MVQKQSRIACLDSLKGIAIIGIIVVHVYNYFQLKGIIGKFCATGSRGVQMFFIISTMLLMKSYDHYREKHESGNDKPHKWILLRIIRLVPLYYLFLTIYLLTNDLSAMGITKVNILANYLFMHGLNPYWINKILPQCWYIGTLVLYILVTPVTHKYVNTLNRSLLVFSVSLVAREVIVYIAERYFASGDMIIYNYMVVFSFFSELPIASIGLVLYQLLFKSDVSPKLIDLCKEKCTELSNVLLLAVGAVFFHLVINHGGDIIAFGILFGFLAFLTYTFNYRLICNELFSTLGRNSYGILLSHMIVIELALKVFPATGLGNFVLVVLIAIVLSLLVSILVTKLIEEPIISIVKEHIR